jgi:hypothetical protein
MRITTMTFQEGDLEYLVETAQEGYAEWYRVRAWCGQTVFTFPNEAKVQRFDIREKEESSDGQRSCRATAASLPVSTSGPASAH